MNSELEATQDFSVAQDKGAKRLFERVFPYPSLNDEDDIQTEPQKPNFKPSSVDVDEFVKTESSAGGLTLADLQDISRQAGLDGNARKQQTADFLGSHFNDVSKLSDVYIGTNRISSSDLELYGQMLRANELSANQNSPNVEAWQHLHYDREIKNSFLPLIGGGLGVYGGIRGTEALVHTPRLYQEILAMFIRNPRAAVATVVTGAAATGTASCYAGTKIGDWINRALNGDSINRHFTNEAAPAMKRLMEG